MRVLAFPSGSNEVIAFGGPGLDAAWVVEACRAAGWQAFVPWRPGEPTSVRSLP